MLSTCLPPEVITIVKKKPKTTKRMNAWICYLKKCARTTDLTYLDCVKDKPRAKREYYPKKDYWESEALKGCPIERK
jgi:hypothetical protein